MRNGQISSELIIILSITLMVFLVILSSVNKKLDEQFYNKRLIEAKGYSEALSSKINQVFLVGIGTTAQLNLPLTLTDNTNYSINIFPESRIVEITWMSKSHIRQYTSQIITSNITGNLTDINSKINITYSAGGIVIEI